MIIQVNGMMCVHCKARVESVCKEIPGVTDAVVDLEKKEVTVTGSAAREIIAEAISKAGYEVMFHCINTRGHYQVYDLNGNFLFSADSEREVREELRNYEESAA